MRPACFRHGHRLLYAVLGGMKGITYTQIAQFCVLIFAYTVPAIFISLQLTGQPVPQIGLGSTLADGATCWRSSIALCWIWVFRNTPLRFAVAPSIWPPSPSLMIGTAGLPHVIIRFFTVPTVRAARTSAGWALCSLRFFTRRHPPSPPWRGSILSRHWSLNPVSISRLKSDRRGSKIGSRRVCWASRIKTATV